LALAADKAAMMCFTWPCMQYVNLLETSLQLYIKYHISRFKNQF